MTTAPEKYDVIVAGAGSGGIGAACSAARMGARTLLLEKESVIGGTFVSSGVCCWESSVSGTGLSKEIYMTACKTPLAADIYPREHKNPSYDITLKTNGLSPENGIKGRYGVIIEPRVYLKTCLDILSETGNCRVLTGAELSDASSVSGVVKSVRVRTERGETEFFADYFIDSTGDCALCAALGCGMACGSEARAEYGEPSAFEEKDRSNINGVTLIFRAGAGAGPGLFAEEAPAEEFERRPLWRQRFPNGDLYVNMLPSLTGREFVSLGYEDAFALALKRVRLAWADFKAGNEKLRDCHIIWTAPRLGVRESSRVICERMLTENDIMDGIYAQDYHDIIAVSDHAIDIHGAPAARRTGLLKHPYGVSFRSLIPKGWKNLLAACRGAGFTHIAASSCRLSRTMMQLGQAAGTAAALAQKTLLSAPDVPYAELRAEMDRQGIVLDPEKLERMWRTALKIPEDGGRDF
jgi:hypothetical protein